MQRRERCEQSDTQCRRTQNRKRNEYPEGNAEGETHTKTVNDLPEAHQQCRQPCHPDNFRYGVHCVCTGFWREATAEIYATPATGKVEGLAGWRFYSPRAVRLSRGRSRPVSRM